MFPNSACHGSNFLEEDFWPAWLRIRFKVTSGLPVIRPRSLAGVTENPASHKPRPDPHGFGRMRMLVVTFQAFGSADRLIGRLHRCPRFFAPMSNSEHLS